MAKAEDTADELLRTEFEKAYMCFARSKDNWFCTFCRKKNTDKRVQLSHIIPYSVLRSAHEKGGALSIGTAGQEVGHSNLGYRGYCGSCEDMLSKKGEQRFNPLVHVPLLSDYNSAVHVEGEDAASVSHCALSIWWRAASVGELACEESDEGRDYRKLLERVRVWLHNPKEYLPYGLQFYFVVYHPDDVYLLRRRGLGKPAKDYYGYLSRGNQDRRLQYICMGPVTCYYEYFNLSCFSSSSPIHIPAGEDRHCWFNMEEVMLYMKKVYDIMLQQQVRATDQEPSSSEYPLKIKSADIIPSRICTIYGDKMIFHYHDPFGEEKDFGDMKLQLYKLTKGKGNDPSCNAVLTTPNSPTPPNPPSTQPTIHPSGQGRIRVWLQSVPPEHKTFKIAEKAPVALISWCNITLKELEERVSALNELMNLHDH